MKRTVKFNINEPITATLTAEGAEAYNADHESFWKAYPHWATPQKAGNVVKVQLWQAMRTWGRMLFAGGPIAFVGCEILMDVDAPDADAEIARLKAENARLTRDVESQQSALDLEFAVHAETKAEIARLRESQRWIPVGEKLPPLRNDHLSTVESRPVLVRSFDPKWPFSNDNRVQEATWIFDPESEDEDEEVGCWAAAPGQSRNGYNRLHWVTHWMPLPSPPEQTTPEVK